MPTAIPCSVLSSYLSYPLLSFQTGGILSHRNSSIHRFPQFPPRNLCSLVMLARDVLSCLCCNGHSLLLSSYLSRIGRILPAASVDTRPRTSLISFCTAQLQTFCAAHSLATLCLSTISGPDIGSCPASGAPWSSAMPPSLRKGRVTNNSNSTFSLEPLTTVFLRIASYPLLSNACIHLKSFSFKFSMLITHESKVICSQNFIHQLFVIQQLQLRIPTALHESTAALTCCCGC